MTQTAADTQRDILYKSQLFTEFRCSWIKKMSNYFAQKTQFIASSKAAWTCL